MRGYGWAGGEHTFVVLSSAFAMACRYVDSFEAALGPQSIALMDQMGGYSINEFLNGGRGEKQEGSKVFAQ